MDSNDKAVEAYCEKRLAEAIKANKRVGSQRSKILLHYWEVIVQDFKKGEPDSARRHWKRAGSPKA